MGCNGGQAGYVFYWISGGGVDAEGDEDDEDGECDEDEGVGYLARLSVTTWIWVRLFSFGRNECDLLMADDPMACQTVWGRRILLLSF